MNAPERKAGTAPSFAGVAYDKALADTLALVPALRERAHERVLVLRPGESGRLGRGRVHRAATLSILE